MGADVVHLIQLACQTGWQRWRDTAGCQAARTHQSGSPSCKAAQTPSTHATRLQVGKDAEGVDVGAEKQELIQLADEYSKLDAEDIVGGIRTRFRYREVLGLCMQSCWLGCSGVLAQLLRQKPRIAPLMPVASQAPGACLPWLLLAGA